MKAKIDNALDYSKCWQFGDRDKTDIYCPRKKVAQKEYKNTTGLERVID